MDTAVTIALVEAVKTRRRRSASSSREADGN
jgi:hypothetical protein